MKHIFGAAFLCGALLLSPVVVQAQSTTSQQDLYQATLLQLIDALLAQIEELQAELERREDFSSVQNSLDTEESTPRQIVERDFLGGSARVEEQYVVDGEDSYRDIPYWSHRRYLREVMQVIPDAYQDRVGEFVVFDDKENNFDAFVQTIPPDHRLWTFGVHEDVLDDVGSDANAELIVHEFAHIFGYDEVPGVLDSGRSSCHSYFENGCPDSNSYLMQFVDEFWSNNELTRVEQYRSARDPLDEAFDYYETIEDEDIFITDYASVAPEEDFAESFAIYVMNRTRNDSSLAKQKVWWFDQYPEIRETRSEIRRNN